MGAQTCTFGRTGRVLHRNSAVRIAFYRQVVFGGLGAAEAYPRLLGLRQPRNLVRIFCRNADVVGDIGAGAPGLTLSHLGASDAAQQSSGRAQYCRTTTGQRFLALFLDETLAYSWIFPETASSQHEARLLNSNASAGN